MPIPEDFEARVGLLIPPPNAVMEVEFNRWIPPTVAVHATRMYRSTSDVTVDSLLEMAQHANEAARLLAMTLPDIILFGCTSGSLILGEGWDQEIIQGIESTTGIRASTTSTAVVSALRAAGACTVAVATPYSEEVNAREQRFLEAHGFQVLAIQGLGLVKSEQMARVAPSRVHEFARACDHPEADALFISCTNFRTREVIDQLEEELGKPVVTSNQASLWMCLQTIGVGRPLSCGGGLLKGRYQWRVANPLNG